MQTTLVILATIAVAVFAWTQLKALTREQRNLQPTRIRTEDTRPRTRR
ncbi:MAG: hypothetical protein GYB21_08745 [Oceanospirillales bacterium]|nr:hypothetical protein [Oceanospirillales bacterium]